MPRVPRTNVGRQRTGQQQAVAKCGRNDGDQAGPLHQHHRHQRHHSAGQPREGRVRAGGERLDRRQASQETPAAAHGRRIAVRVTSIKSNTMSPTVTAASRAWIKVLAV